jgi:hypothetical protein
MRRTIFCLLLVAFAWQAAATAQTKGYVEGDRVETPDGRTAVVEAFRMPDMAKVKFDDGTTRFYMRSDLKKVEPPKPAPGGPRETFRVGDMVIDPRTPDRRFKIYSISGDSAVIYQDLGKYAMNTAITVKLADIVSLKTWERREGDEKEQKLLRAAFEDEARPFTETVESLAHAYDEKYRGSTFNTSARLYAKWEKDLESLAAVCRKYPNLTNPELPDYRKNDPFITDAPADWCGMAERRADVLDRMRMANGAARIKRVEGGIAIHAIEEALRNRRGTVKDDLQLLVFDRAAWEQKNFQTLRENYAGAGAKIPAELLKPLYDKADELKAKIEQDARTREWTEPAYHDAALEAAVRAAYLKQYPGVKVYKTGMTFATWKAEDDTSLVSQGTDYKVYRTTKGAYRYKLGLALVKLPNQPYCQVRDFQFNQYQAGAGYGAAKLTEPIAYSGMFVKCPQ